MAEITKRAVDKLNFSKIFVRDAYRNLQELFNQAYDNAEREKNKEDIEKLEKFRKKIAPLTESYKDNPEKMIDMTEKIKEGMNILEAIKTPEIYKPLRNFAIEKASDTFSNVAFKAYKKFKETAPIISIENPPAGMGLYRAEEIKELIEKTREKFVEKARKEGTSESEAKKQADKLIGATWDIGHINMLRKYGYEEKHLLEETKKLAKDIKHIHLSDNFGMEHTELPMGMGNVPTKKHMELIEKYGKQAEKIKKIIEAGDWIQHFQTVPFSETLQAFGSPVYAMKMAPYWNNTANNIGQYFSGYGDNPDIHQSIYGSGFSGLPVGLGGQIAGKSRLSGAPIE